MARCCCYRKYDGSDQGCATVAGDSCPTIAGYELVSSSPGPCDASCKASPELQELIAAASKDAASTGARALMDKISSTGADSPVKNKFSVELLSGIDDGELKVCLCTGSVLLLPKSIVQKVVGPVVSEGENESHLYARVELNSSTPEGKVICQLAADIESLTSAQRNGGGSATAFDSGDTKVYLYGTACKYGGNKTNVTFNNPISSYSLGSLGGDEGVFIMRHRKLNSRTVEIVHDRTAVCGTSYRGDLILYYDA
jgi:hypothetical protein